MHPIKGGLGSKTAVFTQDEVKRIDTILKDIESRLFDLTAKDLRKHAFQLAHKNHKHHPLNDGKRRDN